MLEGRLIFWHAASFLRKFECFDDDNFPGSAYKGSYILEIAQGIEIDSTLTQSEKEVLINRSSI
jgi:hypothetical protein